MRPSSLAEVAHRLLAGEPAWKAIAEFLDQFYAAPDAAAAHAMLVNEPDPTGNPEHDAVLAAVADWLSEIYTSRPAPAWTAQPQRLLGEPLFPSAADNPDMKAWLYWNSPVQFRRHNIFTEDKPLRRKMSGRVTWAPEATWDPRFRREAGMTPAELAQFEQRRRNFAKALSADTEDLELNYRPPDPKSGR